MNNGVPATYTNSQITHTPTSDKCPIFRSSKSNHPFVDGSRGGQVDDDSKTDSDDESKYP